MSKEDESENDNEGKKPKHTGIKLMSKIIEEKNKVD